ncbi:protachykinin-1 [Gracilinanus agilis]|uniref:protachykinin-1 n=1 Tax=Gracilinanus agilis TaxID=191870 RepID=UPI001CFD21FD|nr:protachykinin-1 [Gracilinanus agilis]
MQLLVMLQFLRSTARAWALSPNELHTPDLRGAGGYEPSPFRVAAEELSEPFEHFLQRIARRPKPQQFFGLMGKRDAEMPGASPSLPASYMHSSNLKVPETPGMGATLPYTSIEKQVGMLKALYGHGGQMSHKRHKTDSFVGLMGKRSLTSGSSEWSAAAAAQNYERRRK